MGAALDDDTAHGLPQVQKPVLGQTEAQQTMKCFMCDFNDRLIALGFDGPLHGQPIPGESFAFINVLMPSGSVAPIPVVTVDGRMLEPQGMIPLDMTCPLGHPYFQIADEALRGRS